jgi:hypothetical protein
MAHALPRDHKGDYGIDGSFHTISARGRHSGSRRTAPSPQRHDAGAAPRRPNDHRRLVGDAAARRPPPRTRLEPNRT